MRRTLPLLSCLSLLLLAGTRVEAAVSVHVSNDPADFQQVQSDLQQIDTALEEAQCGGWNQGVSVKGKVATITGLPGFEHQWDGAINSGMGTRTGEFVFPESTKGLATTCPSYTSTVSKTVWRSGGSRPDEIVQKDVTYPSPYFEDPTCRWRLKDDEQPPIPLQEDGQLEYEELQDKPDDRQREETCQGFCGYLNTFQYADCLDVQGAIDLTTEPPEIYGICAKWGRRFLCSDEVVPEGGIGNVCDPATAPETPFPNSRSCQGEACRCSGPGCIESSNGNFYYSYYRKYTASFEREAVATDSSEEGEEPTDVESEEEIPVACYGIYDEFDTRSRQTHYWDQRCVINIDVSTRRETQTGKGEYGQNALWPDPTPTSLARQTASGAYDAKKDPWYENLGGAFSLLNERTFTELYDNDLSNAYLDMDHLDTAKLRTTVQLSPARKTATGSLMRAFDDTGEERTVVRWWQKQQTEMSTILHRPVVRLLLPAGWAFGADPLDPLLVKTVKRSGNGNPRSERIELQIDADEDILGEAIAAIERSLLLQVREEPVPVIVPVGSPVEFRAKAQAWCSWYMQKTLSKSCTDAPGKVGLLIKQLQTYADQVERVRVLRGELARYAGKLLTLQQSLTAPISQWTKQNLTRYQEVLAEQQTISDELLPKWRLVQELQNQFETQINLPWCMNQRYTAPILSLLDEWLPAREDAGSLAADKLPDLAGTKRPTDLLIDFSTIAYMTGSLVLPVLQPIQIRLSAIPTPPMLTEEANLPDDLPDLPSLTAIQDAVRTSMTTLPRVATGSRLPPAPTLPAPLGAPTLARLNATLDEMTFTLLRRNNTYDRFWKSVQPLTDEEEEEEEDPDADTVAMQKRNLECKDWATLPCEHVEMDLLERLQRIASRPLVLLQEDYESTAMIRRTSSVCMPEDETCLLLHPEEVPSRVQWDIRGKVRNTNPALPLRDTIRDLTLPTPVGEVDPKKMPPYDSNGSDLLPGHDIPEAFPLIPSS